jgi:hypothetical protein
MDGTVVPGADAGGQVRDAGDEAPADAAADLASDASVDGAHEDAAADAARPWDAPVALPPGRYRALTVVAGRYHTCAILDDHRVKCWGDNNYGQLGIGDYRSRVAPADMGDALPTVDLGPGRTAKAITAGRYASCALLDDDSVKCWGWGALALGSDYVLPDGFHGYTPTLVNLGAGRRARLLALGYEDGCIVKDDDTLHCWSSNAPTFEQPPDATRRIVRLVGGLGVAALYDDGSMQMVAGFDDLPTPPLENGVPVAAAVVAASYNEVCVIWTSGDSDCGRSLKPMLWWPADQARDVVAAGVLEASTYACGILRDGHVVCPRVTGHEPWLVDPGISSRTPVRLGQPAVAITGGAIVHFCAALQNGEVKCWPSSDYGTIATSTTKGLGGILPTETDWPSVDLGTRPPR